jgi:hypothetical protein
MPHGADSSPESPRRGAHSPPATRRASTAPCAAHALPLWQVSIRDDLMRGRERGANKRGRRIGARRAPDKGGFGPGFAGARKPWCSREGESWACRGAWIRPADG